MAPEKRNVYLDVEDSEEDDNQSYDSEAEDLRKGGRGAKRRKVDNAASSDDEEDEEEDGFSAADDDGEDTWDDLYEEAPRSEQSQETDKVKAEKRRGKKQKQVGAADEDEDDAEDDNDDRDHRRQRTGKKHASRKDNDGGDDDDDDDEPDTDLPGVSKPLTKKNLVASEKAVRRSGVVYLSRVPPFMKPAKLRSLLAPYGAINRIFLSPEDPQAHARRVRGGGNKKRSYADGWVEFVRKRDAKRAVDLLHARTIGGKKGTYYRDDLWSLVYLRGFKWHHLTEQIATENAERASRMRAEIAQTTRENKLFLQNVERAKMLEGMAAKAEAKAQGSTGRAGNESAASAAATAEDTGGAAEEAAAVPRSARVRSFKQNKLVTRDDRDEQPEHVQRVLNQIF
ncbi:u3 snornp-associated protein esf2 [Niveomyces insectorum RCEF 264]|uniref:18S rRNA factor 2 n=1 Tax=Niveomyces insectorum RCEF 264 TaxID=1081102 RepID=A0A168A5Y3_9HYPO|nr:u3 snornp-associated protein esf2 [Niveomyces insectorum RCEF 264]